MLQPRHMSREELIQTAIDQATDNPLAYHLALMLEGEDEEIFNLEEEIRSLEIEIRRFERQCADLEKRKRDPADL